MTISQPVEPASLYRGIELTIDTDGVWANPFDPAQVDLRVRFTSPSGKVASVPAFWYQDFDSTAVVRRGKPGWRARFTPTEPGAWTAQADLAVPALKSRPLSFSVAPDPRARGFVRVSSRNPRYFAFDDGSLYLPIGLNLGWAGEDPLGDYDRWLAALSQNGGNTARVWMASWSFGIEWNDTGLGDYAARMKQAWLLDQVFNMAEQRGVYLMLCLLNHGAFSTGSDPEWASNPYNVKLGGPIQRPQDFVTDPRAKDYFKRRLRYIAARWGYSPALMAWEWWNEVDLTPIRADQLLPWVAEMSAELEKYDPNHHLVSSSYAHDAGSPLWRAPQIDFAQQHDYSAKDALPSLAVSFARIASTAPDKPALLSEYGYSPSAEDRVYPGEAVHFHNGLWAAPFAGYAGTALYWWWDRYIDRNNFWPEFRGVAEFFKDENLAALRPGDLRVNAAGASGGTLQTADRALAWIRANAYTMPSYLAAYEQAVKAGEAASPWTFNPPQVAGATITLAGLRDGSYDAIWYDPREAKWQPPQLVNVAGGSLTLPVPEFNRDLALKVLPAR